MISETFFNERFSGLISRKILRSKEFQQKLDESALVIDFRRTKREKRLTSVIRVSPFSIVGNKQKDQPLGTQFDTNKDINLSGFSMLFPLTALSSMKPCMREAIKLQVNIPTFVTKRLRKLHKSAVHSCSPRKTR